MTMTPLPLSALERIERLCEAATKGPYIVQGLGCQGPRRFIRVASAYCKDAVGVVHGIMKFAQHNAEANAAYIAALDPQTVLALVQEIKMARLGSDSADLTPRTPPVAAQGQSKPDTSGAPHD